LNKIISQIQGVLNLNYIKVFNKTTSGYSQNTINQNILDTSTGEIDITTGILNCDENQILQLRNPNSDIVVIPVVSTPIRTLI
jgi:hypothetical protein